MVRKFVITLGKLELCHGVLYVYKHLIYLVRIIRNACISCVQNEFVQSIIRRQNRPRNHLNLRVPLLRALRALARRPRRHRQSCPILPVALTLSRVRSLHAGRRCPHPWDLLCHHLQHVPQYS